MRHKISRRDRGQTIIELLVTLSVVVGLTSMLVVYSRTGQRVSNVARAAEALVFNLRRVQDYALNVRAKDSGLIPCAWGIHFDAGQGSYVIFADVPSGGSPDCSAANGIFDPSELVETVNMEIGVIVTPTTNVTDITFVPPFATVSIMPLGVPFPARISLGLTGGPSFTRTVSVNQPGRIQVEAP